MRAPQPLSCCSREESVSCRSTPSALKATAWSPPYSLPCPYPGGSSRLPLFLFLFSLLRLLLASCSHAFGHSVCPSPTWGLIMTHLDLESGL